MKEVVFESTRGTQPLLEIIERAFTNSVSENNQSNLNRSQIRDIREWIGNGVKIVSSRKINWF